MRSIIATSLQRVALISLALLPALSGGALAWDIALPFSGGRLLACWLGARCQLVCRSSFTKAAVVSAIAVGMIGRNSSLM
jgi:hypothetical protein